MADSYLDMGANMFSVAMLESTFRGVNQKTELQSESLEHSNQPSSRLSRKRQLKYFDPRLFEVRQCICVAGVSRDAVTQVKSLVASLMSDQLQLQPAVPLESFHVKCPGDVKDGALFVPKVVLAATHCPGLRLIDNSDRNEGQLDYMYDEICDIGADVLVIYINLPRAIYAPNRSFVYHQRFAELVFPDQPVLQSLAMENALITVTENTSLNHVQRNVIREWISKPVGTDHRVYQTAAGYMTEAENQLSEASYWSETEVLRDQRIPRGLALGWSGLSRGFASATEERPDQSSAGTTSRKVKRKKKRFYGSRDSADYRSELKPLLESGNYDSQELLLLNDAYDDDSKYGTETDHL